MLRVVKSNFFLAQALVSKLQAANVDLENLTDATIKRVLQKVSRRTQFVVETRSLAEGQALEDGRVLPLIPKRQKVSIRR